MSIWVNNFTFQHPLTDAALSSKKTTLHPPFLLYWIWALYNLFRIFILLYLTNYIHPSCSYSKTRKKEARNQGLNSMYQWFRSLTYLYTKSLNTLTSWSWGPILCATWFSLQHLTSQRIYARCGIMQVAWKRHLFQCLSQTQDQGGWWKTWIVCALPCIDIQHTTERKYYPRLASSPSHRINILSSYCWLGFWWLWCTFIVPNDICTCFQGRKVQKIQACWPLISKMASEWASSVWARWLLVCTCVDLAGRRVFLILLITCGAGVWFQYEVRESENDEWHYKWYITSQAEGM